MIVMTLVIMLILFIVLCFGIGQVVWIYLDAKERRDRLAPVWAIFSLFPIIYPLLLPLPLVVYLLISRSFDYRCPTCNEKIKSDFIICPSCGQTLKEQCSQCKRAVEKDWNYCPDCSSSLK